MKVLIVEQGKTPYEAEIKPDLSSMQSVVGGYIEAVHPNDDLVVLVCNEEGKINGMPLNRALYNEDRQMLDIIAGTFFICGLAEDDFCSLSPEQAKKYMNKFRNPERFLKFGDEIIAIPY